MKQLIILAGGKGTRLKTVLGNKPKPLVDVCGKPLLERQIELAKRYGFTDIVITLHYQAEMIREYFGDGNEWSVNIRYFIEEKALGTAGAILTQLDLLADQFMIMYGDTMLDVDLNAFWHFHQQQNADASIFLHPNDHPQDSDLVEIDEASYITHFHPYPHAADRYYPNLVNAALYVINKQALDDWQSISIPPQGIDFAKQLFPSMLDKKKKLCGYISTEYIKDVGTIERIAQVSKDLLKGKIAKRSKQTPQSAVFIDRDGTLTQQTNYVTTKEQLQLVPTASHAIKQINTEGDLAILVTNQPVIARGDCSAAELKQIHYKLETLLGNEGAYLDAIYYCPHHPDKGFSGERIEFKIACECRKPGIGMIQAAQNAHSIDLSSSWFIGDSSVDMQAAKNAGIKSMLVRTGCGGYDDKYAARPDFEAYDLNEAVQFIYEKFPSLMQKAKTQATPIKRGEKVIIGGLARSGKSTWASLLKLALNEQQIPCAIISLDGWIKDFNQRDKGDVLSRHDINAINDLLKTLQNIHTSITLQIPTYNRKLRKPNKNLESITITPEHVILFEGVTAFLLDELLETAAHHFYVFAPDVIRLEKFQKEYQLRGFSDEEIKQLQQTREEDENCLIKANIAAKSAILIEGN